MSQNIAIRLDKTAPAALVALAQKIREIEDAAKSYHEGVQQIFEARLALDERTRTLLATVHTTPSAATMKELVAARAEQMAFDAVQVRFATPDELLRDNLPAKFPDMAQIANKACQALVDFAHPLLLESQQTDAEAAASLGVGEIVSTRTASIQKLIEIAMVGTWGAAVLLTAKILDGESADGAIPRAIR